MAIAVKLLPQNPNFSDFTKSPQQDPRQLHALYLKSGTLYHPSFSSHLLSLYTHPIINNLHHARSLFLSLPFPPSFISFNLIISCYLHNHLSGDALHVFDEMLHHYMPDRFTFPCVIKGCARLGAVSEGKQVHGLALKIGFREDKFVQSSLVSMYAKFGDMVVARQVFDRMPDRDLVSWNALVDGYARNGDVEVALKLFHEMPSRDSFTWTALVDGLSKCGMVDAAREMFDQMPNKNLVSWNAMINGYMKSGRINLARQLFQQMPTRNTVSWNSMIAGYELNGRFFEALELFEALLEEGIMPNHVTILSALSAVSGLAVLGNGRWIHSFMVKHRFELDGVLGTSLIEMYSKCGSIDSAMQIFKAIANKKLGHWTAIIVGLGMHGLADQALQLFKEMCIIGMKPHDITFVGVLNACSHAGLVDEGRRIFHMMINEYKIEPTIEHYGCLVDILCRAGYLEQAKNTIESMPMRPNKFIWMSLLGGSRNHGNLEIGEYAARNLIEVDPDLAGCYTVLSNMYAAAGKWNKVSHLREMMKKQGVTKNAGCSYIEHRGQLHRFIVGDRSHPQTEDIYAKLREMRKKLKLAGHVPDTSQVLLNIEGEKEKEAELENHSERLAISFGLINIIESRTPIRIMKNLRVCNDCHAVTKLLSLIYNHEIIVRDNSRFHHFKNGSCSCNDFW